MSDGQGQLTLLQRFWIVLDTEGVGLFQVVFYVTLIVAGLQNYLVARSGPLTLHGSMSHQTILLWDMANALGPACCLFGKWMCHAESSSSSTHFSLRPGEVLQLVGDVTINVALLAYMTATFHVEPWGKGGYGGYLAFATWLSTLLLTVRDIRRISGRGGGSETR